MCSKISKRCWAIENIKVFVNTKTLLIIHSLIYPHLQYCITSWVGSDSFSTVPTERPHHPPPKKCQKVTPPKQNIAVFLRGSTMTVAPLSAS